MSRIKLIIPLLVLCLLCSCKGEKNIVTYETLYQEQPLTILLAPVQDNSKRSLPKTTQDQVLNDQLDAAAHYLRQSLSTPLVSQGYYVIAPLASDAIVTQTGKDYRSLMNGDLKEFSSRYGIDAVLLAAIHKWEKPEENEIVVYVEYTLRSTKTGQELFHNWVRGRKFQPVDTKGKPVELASDLDFINLTEFDSPLAHRCILLEQVSDFVLRGLPTSANRWYFKHDKYIPSAPAYYRFDLMYDGSVEQSDYTEDAFGNECFTD